MEDPRHAPLPIQRRASPSRDPKTIRSGCADLLVTRSEPIIPVESTMQPRSRITVDRGSHSDKKARASCWLATIGLLSVLGAVASASAGVDDQDAAAVGAIPASVSTVVQGGLWGTRGSYRVVVIQQGFEHIYSKTYAQWLNTNDKGESRVEKSVRVNQLSNLIPSVIGDVRIALASKQSDGVFEVEVVDRNSQKSSIALLHMGKPGEVSVELPPDEPAE